MLVARGVQSALGLSARVPGSSFTVQVGSATTSVRMEEPR